jgi:hypothetical protein
LVNPGDLVESDSQIGRRKGFHTPSYLLALGTRVNDAVETLLVIVKNWVCSPMGGHMVKEFFERQVNLLVAINSEELFYFPSICELH